MTNTLYSKHRMALSTTVHGAVNDYIDHCKADNLDPLECAFNAADILISAAATGAVACDRIPKEYFMELVGIVYDRVDDLRLDLLKDSVR